jgi:predicted nucleic acid-binding protein
MAIAVNDANIFIDLLEIDLIDTFFELKLDLHTTNLVLNELDYEQQIIIKKQIAKKRLKVKILNDEELSELKEKEITSSKLSKQDVSVYAYAKELGAIILTSDRRLRIEAKSKGFEVHGILWVFEKMMEEKLIKPKKAIDKLTELMKINTWLPMDECHKRIEKWSK